MQATLKTLLMLTLLACLGGCQQLVHPEPLGIYAGMRDKAPEGTPSFRSGWKDGCESGMAVYGTYHYKLTHEYAYDADMINDPEYHNAWRLGFRHCRWYTAEWTKPWF